MTFLAIDIGNTRLKWAMYDAPRHGASLLAQGAEFLEQIEQLADGPWSRLPAPCCLAGPEQGHLPHSKKGKTNKHRDHRMHLRTRLRVMSLGRA